jgi:hypothetical protein
MDKANEGNTVAAQSKQKVAEQLGWPHTALLQQHV